MSAISNSPKFKLTLKSKNSYTSEYKLKAIKHYQNYGIDSTLDAFEISRASLFNWIKKYKNSKLIESLNNQSRKPVNHRKREVSPRITKILQSLRLQYPFLGKAKLKAMLDKYCKESGLKTISESTVGRLLSDLKKNKQIPVFPKKFTFEAKTGRILPKTKNQRSKQEKIRRNGYLPKNPGDLIQLDTVEKFLDGVKRYVISATDYVSSFTFSLTYKNLSSSTAKDFFQKLEQVTPFEISRVQTDNGQENHKYFRQYLEKRNIIQFYNYPRTPKSNGKIERYNGVIQFEFIDRNLDLLRECCRRDNLDEFNSKLIEYLVFYNTLRPHHSLDLQTPIDYLMKANPKSKMWWTRTKG